ncbi:MAG: metallophosphoesterase family protein [Planctomycetota bacterium]|jgi:UDP-2,3-diacylglucosamine pyrophosphatase LpxH
MLVFISDLHFTDGTSGETITDRAFRVFRERFRDMIYDASWREDGKYKPIEQVDLVLLGDIFDVIRSSKWLKGEVRPWDNPKSTKFINRIGGITDSILEHNKKSLACLKSFQNPKIMTIPKARDGKPLKVSKDSDAPNRIPVQVNIHYMAGNHDWFFHLEAPAYDIIRKKIVKAVGLANNPKKPFPHHQYENNDLHELFRKHKVAARHGDIFDPFNYDGERDASSLGDAIVIELLNRFPSEVKKQMKGQLPQKCIKGLKEIDNIRPLMIVPVWINGLLRRTCTDSQQRKIKKIWDELADQFLKIQFVKDHDTWYQFDDLVDKLRLALLFSRGASMSTLSRFMTWLNKLGQGKKKSDYKNAFSEPDFKNRSSRYIVYGHSHRHEIVPLDSCKLNGEQFDQMYINTGTWRQVHELARQNPKEEEFMGFKVMTYVAVYNDNQRGGQTFETWSGSLG